MKRNLKKMTALLASLVLIVSALPLTAWAADVPDTAEDGSYLLGTAEDLIWFSEEVTNGNQDINAQLTADIDLSGEAFTPIGGDGGWYGGIFNGNGFTVTVAITAEEDFMCSNVGLFSYLDGATVKNLKIAGNIYVENENCQFIGGLTGALFDAQIVNCANAAAITVESEAYAVGGLVGMVEGSGMELTACANHGTIMAENSGSVGGLLGSSSGENVTIMYDYNSGSVTGSVYTGGLVGEGAVQVVSCYSSAGLEDWGAPNGLCSTGLVSGGTVGDFFGYFDTSRSIRNSLCYTDLIEGSGYLTVSEFENCKRFCECDTVDEMLLLLNDGRDEPVFVIDGNGFGDGWPVLVWELKGGTTPEEQDKALNEAKEQAIREIDALYSDEMIRQNYEEEDRKRIADYRDKALAAINAAVEAETVTAVLKALKTDIEAVPTASDRLADYKKAAVAAVEKAYFYQEVGPYSTRDFGYRADLDKIVVKAGQLGLRHDKKEKLLQLLDGDRAVLARQKEEGVAAVNTADSPAAVETEKAAAVAAMEQTVIDSGRRTVDSGVVNKWDGVTKTQPSGSGTASDPYCIGTAAELAWFADSVNADKPGLHAVLTADVDLGAKDWVPIAVKSDDHQAYTGTFDGCGYTVHGLYVNVTKEQGGFLGGLFGNIGSGGTVKALQVAGLIRQELGNEYLRDDEKRMYAVGGIAGRSAGLVYDCESSVALTHGAQYSNCNYMGGLVGHQSGGILEKCVSYAVLFQNGSSNFQSCFGGVVGYSGNNSLIRYTDSYAEIDLGQNVLSNIGGIVGILCDTAQVRECSHFGTVHFGNGIAGSVLRQASLAYVKNSGTVDGENNRSIMPGASIAGYVDTSGRLIGLYNDGGCVYGLVNVLVRGTIQTAQSSAAASLWGKVDIQHSVMRNCVRVERIEPEESTRSAGALGQAKLEAARTLLGKIKTNTDRVYGTNSDAYNAVVLNGLRKTELADNTDEITALLSATEEELKGVSTQLAIEKEETVRLFRAYVAERVYDESDQAVMDALLAEAIARAEAVATVKALASERDKYLGTEKQPGRFETSCDTYPVKAKNELYNEYLYGKTYREKDMAELYACYEKWGLQLDRSASVEETEIRFAGARKALHDLAETMTETGSEPDGEKVKTAALVLAKEAAQKEMTELFREGKAKVEKVRQSTDGKNYSSGFLKVLQRLSDGFAEREKTLAEPDWQKADSFEKVEAVLQTAQNKLNRYIENAVRRMKVLISLAEKAAEQAWDGETLTEPVCSDGVYQIANGAELAWLAHYVNSQSSRKVSAKLTADIDLAYHEWMPMGLTALNGNGFYGTLDGNGHRIKGLYISRKNDDGYYGLIGVLRSQSVVRDLTVDGTIELEGLETRECVGSLVAAGYPATVKNCRSHVEIYLRKIAGSSPYAVAVGGVIGKVVCDFFNEHNELTVSDSAFHGLIALTETENNREPKGVGGVIGKIEGAANLLRCVNYGTVETDKALGVGGVVGLISTYEKKGVRLTECANEGSISNDADNVMAEKGGTGGLIGVVASETVTVSDCYNTGTINASKLAGGILGGENESFGTGSSAVGSRQFVLKNSYNAGKLLGPNNQSSVKIGALAGYPLEGAYKDELYYLSGCAQTDFGWISSQGAAVRCVTAAELDDRFADGVKMIRSVASLNGGYPLFLWQLSDETVREEIAGYLERCYEEEIKSFASAEQVKSIALFLDRQTKTIRKETAPGTVLEAYNAAVNAMDKPKLLAEAALAVRKTLAAKTEFYTEKYSLYAPTIEAFRETLMREIDEAESPAEMDTVTDRFDAAVVECLIEHIGTIDETISADEAAAVGVRIEVARSAYEALTEAQKNQVGNFVKLREAQTALSVWKKVCADDQAAADAVADLIRVIGTVTLDSQSVIETARNAYMALSERQRARVSETARTALENAVKQYNELAEAYRADVKIVAEVARKIAAIGQVTLESKRAIGEAQNAYRTLTDSQKTMLSESVYEILQKAIAAYATLEKADRENRAAAAAAAEQIRAIGTVTEASGTLLAAARAAYEVLTPAQKGYLDLNVLKVLTEAEAIYAQLIRAGNSAVSKPTAPSGSTAPSEPTTSESLTSVPSVSRNDSVAEPTRPAETAPTGNPGKSVPAMQAEPVFDASILWIFGGIVLAAAVVLALVCWFVAANRKKRK